MSPRKPSSKPAGTHLDMKIECLPRKSHVVTFDDAVSALKLAPAANGIGAVLDAWTDPIGMHDKKVLEVEQAMLKEKDLVSRGSRLYRRHCGARTGDGVAKYANVARYANLCRTIPAIL